MKTLLKQRFHLLFSRIYKDLMSNKYALWKSFLEKIRNFIHKVFCGEFKNACQAFFEKMWITF